MLPCFTVLNLLHTLRVRCCHCVNQFVIRIWKFPGKVLYLLIWNHLFLNEYLHWFTTPWVWLLFWMMLFCERGSKSVSFIGNLVDLTDFFVNRLHAPQAFFFLDRFYTVQRVIMGPEYYFGHKTIPTLIDSTWIDRSQNALQPISLQQLQGEPGGLT